jgi:hypothetical protein
MKETINTPYVKKYDKNGKVINPITMYIPDGENRKKRREKNSTHKFMNNRKGMPLTVVGKFKFIRHIQLIMCKDGLKRIYHYLSV